MCIRDRTGTALTDNATGATASRSDAAAIKAYLDACLLYTSDAADERSSVDLGGRRIIKKKKKTTTSGVD